MSLTGIKKELGTKIATLHQQWRATNDITFSREAQQLQYARDLIALEEQKIKERIRMFEEEAQKTDGWTFDKDRIDELRRVIGK